MVVTADNVVPSETPQAASTPLKPTSNTTIIPENLKYAAKSLENISEQHRFSNENDNDLAFEIALQSHGTTVTPSADKVILRKMDSYIIPICCVLYMLQFADKSALSYSAIMGIKQHFHMTGPQYSWAASAFYFGYLVFSFPASYLLQRFPLMKTTGIFVILWGIIVALHSVPNKYASFMVLRVLLGAFECVVTPAFALLMSQWYKSEENFLRMSIWYGFNGVGNIFVSLIAYGLVSHKNLLPIPGWKLLYIILGVITVLFGVILLSILPDTPAQAWWLSEKEKKIVVERIRKNQQGFGNRKFKFHQFAEAFQDIRSWIYFTLGIAVSIPNGGVSSFGSILLTSDFGFHVIKSMLMRMPTGAIELVGCAAFGVLANSVLHNKRLISSFIAMAIVLMAGCLLAFADSKKSQLAGYYLLGLTPVSMILCLSCVSTNTLGHTKKVTVNAMYLVGYCTGNIIGPQTFVSSQAPDYRGAKVTIVVCYAISLVLIGLTYYINIMENRRRDNIELRDPRYMSTNIEFADMTDFENSQFRYAL